jgi:protein involved in polysaccharide export with SLBB domain
MIGCNSGNRAGAALAGVMLLVAIAGCGGTQAFVPRSEFIPFTPEQKVVMDAQSSNAYRIQEGDILKVYFAYEHELNQDNVVVLNDGAVTLTSVDRIRLAGHTMAEADSIITAAYSREYREPDLSVMIQETSGRRVYVLGQVRNPGFYQVPNGGIDIIGVITMAGGFADDSAPAGTLVVRVTGDGYQFQEVNLEKFGKPGFAPFAAIPLRSYDIVYVPRSRVGDFSYFTKSVLTGLGYITRMAYDLYTVSSHVTGRY